MARAIAHAERIEAPGPRAETQGNFFLVMVALAAIFLLLVGLLGNARGAATPEENLLYGALVCYGAASALYIAFGIGARARHAAAARLATGAGLLLNTLAIAHRWYVSGHAPFSSVYEMLLSFVWTMAALTLLLEWRYAVRLLGSVTLPLATLGVLLMQLLPSAVRPLVPALQSFWLHVHVTLAMLAYAACAVSFALALMFLIRDRMRTETFLISTCALLAVIYAGLATRFHPSGGLRVAAWDAATSQDVFLADRVRLWVVIPGLGWLFFLVLAAVLAPIALYFWGRWNAEERALTWANRAFVLSTVLQALAAAAFVIRVRDGLYAAPQVDGFYATSLAASPFLLAGLFSGLLASLLYLMLRWRRESLENMLPATETLDRLTYKTIGLAFPLLTLMIAAGAYWANQTWGSYWSWDPKETWALITWLAYAGYLHMRLARGWRGRRAAYFAIIGFAVVLFTFFGVTYLLPGLHAYA